jgi:beta-mannosidase
MTLDGIWNLSCAGRGITNIPITIPGDTQTALFAANIIPDPYWGVNEKTIQWVHTVEWTMSRFFNVSLLSVVSAVVLALEFVDGFSSVSINGRHVMDTTNSFNFYRQNVKDFLVEGQNRIDVLFRNISDEARRRGESLLPDTYTQARDTRIKYLNMVRKPEFQGGWDWGPCIVTCGIYKPTQLIPINVFDLAEVAVVQNWEGGSVKLDLEIDVVCYKETKEDTPISIEFGSISETIQIPPSSKGPRTIRHTVKLRGDEKLWTINEFGGPYLHNLRVKCDGKEIEKRVGLRKIELVREKDAHGIGFFFKINGHIVNVKGSDLVPLDSLPARVTYERYYSLLSDVKAAHMNALRLWGGGHYDENLYKAADELGILIWHDLMFACAQSPPVDWFLKEVREELESQVRRNSHHASILFWCGGNEVHQVVAGEGKHDQWLRGQYAKFNMFLKNHTERLDSSRAFWPDSPSRGNYRYQDKGNWSVPYDGDYHCYHWPFEDYYGTKPRFVSEFGFESWPSFALTKTFCPPDEFNISSPTMLNHQRKKNGNDIIQSMFQVYFKKPKNFEEQLYLSQVQQAFAIRMGSEWWRTVRPILRGMIIWQLNDCWPVASWASIEYGGRWKQLHYHAARFFEPLTAVLFERSKKEGLQLTVINDYLDAFVVKGDVKFIGFNGTTIKHWENIEHKAESDTANEVWKLDLSKWSSDERGSGFFYCEFKYEDKGEEKSFSNFFFPARFKDSNMKIARISVSLRHTNLTEIRLKTDYPAFFVHLESSKVRRFSDSSFVLLPGSVKLVTCEESIGLDDFKVYQLAEVGNHSTSAED